MAEANRDDARKSYELSKKFFAQNEHELALKYAEKSVHLYTTEEHRGWLEKIKSISVKRTENKNRAPKEDTPLMEKKPKTDESNTSASFTKEQAEQVRQFLKIDKNDYYAVLGVPRTATDDEIKKSYRKLALKFHPDKNQAPGAEEAFKIVSRAFSCLQDPQQRANYNNFGSEDSTTTGMRTNHFRSQFPFANRGGGGGGFYQAEVSPEELFNMFFGNFDDLDGRGGVHFTNIGTPFTFSYQDGNFRRRRKQEPDPPFSWIALAIQFIPVVVIAILVFLSNFTSSSAVDPWDAYSNYISLTKTPSYTHQFSTSKLKVSYFGTQGYKNYHSKKSRSKQASRGIEDLEDAIERRFVSDLQKKCLEEERSLQEKKVKFANDPIKSKELQDEKAPSCERLHSLGISKK